MAFHEIQFPPRIAYGASGGAEFSTSISTTFAGFEQRNINWRKSRGKWDISTGIKTKSDMDSVIVFFRARYGKAHGFRFKDWSDYQAIGQVLGTGNGTITAFQLVKNYISGASSYARQIKKPVAGTFQIYLNAVLQTSGFTINTTTGVITFLTAPTSGVVVSSDFEFDVLVRFDTDQISVRADGSGIFTWAFLVLCCFQ